VEGDFPKIGVSTYSPLIRIDFGRFDSILTSLTFTKELLPPPTYTDRVWEVRELLDNWNWYVSQEFLSSWISCLDESMSKWVNK